MLSVADPRGAPPPTDQNFLNFMQFLGKLYVGTFPWGVGAPSYGESWTYLWLSTEIIILSTTCTSNKNPHQSLCPNF